MERVSIYQLVSQFNHSEQRKRMIPQELVSGWPCIRKINKTLCITIPYYNRAVHDGRVALYPLYCSVTLPVGNPDRLMDFTIYPNQRDWDDLDYSKPAGYFKHEALADVKSREPSTRHSAGSFMISTTRWWLRFWKRSPLPRRLR